MYDQGQTLTEYVNITQYLLLNHFLFTTPQTKCSLKNYK